MKRIHISLALVTLAGLFTLWVVRSRTGISPPSQACQKQRPDSEPVPKVTLAPMQASIPSSGACSVHPVERVPQPPQSEAPASPSSKLQKQMAVIKSESRDPGETEREAIRATAEFLAIQPASRSAFEAAARQSVFELKMALTALKGDLSAPAQEALSPAARSDARHQAEARYAAARRRAFDRVQPFLVGSTNAKEFQWGFDSWVATVSAQTQPADAESAGK